MKIAFNGIKCGWGNNGGTQSVFRMAVALAKIGHDVQIWSNSPNKFTWFKLPASVRYLKVNSLKNAPAVDVLINSGCGSTIDTYNFSKKKIGIQWLRGHETWKHPENHLFDMYKLKMPLWVNSEWLKNYISRKIDRKIDVQYCGIPTHEFYKIDTNKSEFTIGGLYTLRETKRFNYLRAVMDQVKAKYVFFGNGKNGPGEYCCKPSMIEKRRLYSKCDVWISTSSHEGLHIPPMEAALCGATVVANNKESAGNMDYCKDGKTCMMFDDGKIDQIIAAVNELRDNPDKRADLNHNMRSLIENKIGDVDMNAKLIVEKLDALGIR